MFDPTAALTTHEHTLIQLALAEDIQSGDINAQLLPAHATTVAEVRLKQSTVLCGQTWFNDVFDQLDPTCQIHWLYPEGRWLQGSEDHPLPVAKIMGSVRSILTGERTALNFLQLLSGTATTTKRAIDVLQQAIGHDHHLRIKPQLLDTRKTLPGFRQAQKMAVRCGGGHNHRMGLYDQFLLKENHLMAAGGIANAIALAKSSAPGKTIEVEVENLQEFSDALVHGADIIMLDNFTTPDIATAVSQRNACSSACKLEISGNITPACLTTYAKLGVDYISSGALTKHLQAIDYSLRLQETSKNL